MNLTSEYYYDTDDNQVEMEEPESVRHVAMGMLGVLSVSGIIGNALVLYVFTRQKQKLSSTIFILTLAGTDFVTSLVTMPFTIVMELRRYNVEHDPVCKVYHLLTTTTIPFSASVMVAIAVDRYLCIVHPFKHAMTLKRAKISVVVLAIFSTCIGLPSSLMYGVYQRELLTPADISTVHHLYNITSGPISHLFRDNASDVASSTFNQIEADLVALNMTVVNNNSESFTHIQFTGKCLKNDLIVGKSFFQVYQKIYSSYFAICAVIVIVLYCIIYRSVLARRSKRFHITTSCCMFLSQGQNVEHPEHEQTEFTMLNNKDKSPSNTSTKKFQEESFKNESRGSVPSEGRKSDDRNGNTADKQDANADKENLMRPSGVSRAKMEKLRMANIKTALMLSIVALTYIIAFLPAWLMALRIIPMNPIVFFMYFTYNVANPIIYAFLNQSFRSHLQTLFKCK